MSSLLPTHLNKNGVVERKNRTLLDMARTMLDEYKTPDHFWAKAINVAELLELFRLKCPSPALEARPHLNGNNPSIPRI
jgi:hypothetical protein